MRSKFLTLLIFTTFVTHQTSAMGRTRASHALPIPGIITNINTCFTMPTPTVQRVLPLYTQLYNTQNKLGSMLAELDENHNSFSAERFRLKKHTSKIQKQYTRTFTATLYETDNPELIKAQKSTLKKIQEAYAVYRNLIFFNHHTHFLTEDVAKFATDKNTIIAPTSVESSLNHLHHLHGWQIEQFLKYFTQRRLEFTPNLRELNENIEKWRH
jgi:hypothetical protein